MEMVEGDQPSPTDSDRENVEERIARSIDERSPEDGQSENPDQRPFVCDICDARFNRRSTLWNHRRIHSECRPFVCPTCNHRFKWKNSLKCHRAMHARRGESAEEVEAESSVRERKRRKETATVENRNDEKRRRKSEDAMTSGDESKSSQETPIERKNQYSTDDRSITQLPSLSSVIFQAMDDGDKAIDQRIDWSYDGGDGSEADRADYAKVLPCHMW